MTKKDLKKEHGDGKPTTIRVTQRRPGLLDDYRKVSGERIRRAVSQEDLAEVLKAPKPKWQALAADAVAIPTGAAHTDARGRAVFGFMTALLHPNVTSPDVLNIDDSDFRAWRFDAVSNADGPLSAALAQFPSDAVGLVVLNADLTSAQVPRLIEWLDGADIPLTIVVARSVRKDAAKALTAAAHGVLLFSDADVVAMGEQRAGGPEGVSQFFVVAD